MAAQKSKKKKSTQRQVPVTTPESTPVRAEQAVPTWDITTRQFLLGALGLWIVMLMLSAQSGLNGDDYFQNHYSDHVLSFYTSGGADTSALHHKSGPIKYYGGFYEVQAAVLNNALGLTARDRGYHRVRHLLSATYGMAGAMAAGLLVRALVGSSLWGLLTMILIILSPRYLGHSMMNPKDIPFAAGYMICIYGIYRLTRTIDRLDWKSIAIATIGMAIATGVRVGGVILFGFIGLSYLFDIYRRNRAKKSIPWKNYLISGAIVAFGGTLLGFLFWPYALQDLWNHPREALSEFSQLSTTIRVLYGGENIMSDTTSRWYPVDMIWRTIPIATVIGLIAGVIFSKRIIQKLYWTRWVWLLLVAFLPLGITVASNSVLFDGWRHLSFIYPPLVCLAACGLYELMKRLLRIPQVGKYAWVLIALILVEPTLFIARNHAYPYVYYSPLQGGMSHAYGNYELDYWGVSMKQAIDWMEEEGLLEARADSITVATTFKYALDRYTYGKPIHKKYVRFYERYNSAWDYAIFPTRFIRAGHLKSDRWAGDQVVHTIRASGVPIAVIVKSPGPEVFSGMQAASAQRWTEAIPLLEKAVQLDDGNEQAWAELANGYMKTGNLPKARAAIDKSIALFPDNSQAWNALGLIEINANRADAAELAFNRALELQENPATYYYLGILYQQSDPSRAIQSFQRAIELNPRFTAAYGPLIQLLRSTGNVQAAQRYEQYLRQITGR